MISAERPLARNPQLDVHLSFVLPLPFGVMFGTRREGATRSPLGGEHLVGLSVPLGMVVMWVFHVMERIRGAIENPFEGNPNDADIATIFEGIEIDLREMLNESTETIRSAITARHDMRTCADFVFVPLCVVLTDA